MARPVAFHEDFSRDDKPEGSSDRGFGLVFSGFFAVVAAIKLWKGQPPWVWWLLAAALTLIVALARPKLLAPFNAIWLRIGLLLFRIVSPVTLGLLFFATITPIGVIMRTFDRNFLNLRFRPQARTYWIAREPPGPAPETMKNQF